MAGPGERKAVLDDLTARLEKLKTVFQLYFQGLERFAPVEDREAMRKEIENTRREAARWNTADRFRMNSIHQKFVTYNRMWERSLAEIENGTFRRDLKRVQRKRKAEDVATEKAVEQGLSPEDAAAAAAAAAQAQQARARTNGAAASADGMSEERMRRLYNVYMQAKKRTGEKTNVSFESLQQQLQKQIPALKKKHNCQSVDFKVVLKNGKAMLKAVPK